MVSERLKGNVWREIRWWELKVSVLYIYSFWAYFSGPGVDKICLVLILASIHRDSVLVSG